MTLSPYLRARIQSLRVTGVETRYNVGSDAAVAICPRLAWAAKIAEFEWIEVRNLTRQTRHEAYVVFGEETKAEWWSSGETVIQSGDAVQLSVYAWIRPDSKDERIVHMVRVGRQNRPIEIRRVTARPAPRDPSFFPILPRSEKTMTITPPVPVEATD